MNNKNSHHMSRVDGCPVVPSLVHPCLFSFSWPDVVANCRFLSTSVIVNCIVFNGGAVLVCVYGGTCFCVAHTALESALVHESEEDEESAVDHKRSVYNCCVHVLCRRCRMEMKDKEA